MPEELKENERWVVVRQYSGCTTKNVLWQVLSRGFKRWEDADSWRDFMQSEYDKKTRPCLRYKKITVMKVDVDFL